VVGVEKRLDAHRQGGVPGNVAERQPGDDRNLQRQQPVPQNVAQRLAVFLPAGLGIGAVPVDAHGDAGDLLQHPAFHKCVSRRSKRNGFSDRSSRKRILFLKEGWKGVPKVVQRTDRFPPTSSPRAVPPRKIETVFRRKPWRMPPGGEGSMTVLKSDCRVKAGRSSAHNSEWSIGP